MCLGSSDDCVFVKSRDWGRRVWDSMEDSWRVKETVVGGKMGVLSRSPFDNS